METPGAAAAIDHPAVGPIAPKSIHRNRIRGACPFETGGRSPLLTLNEAL
jgi:hypothetical protein